MGILTACLLLFVQNRLDASRDSLQFVNNLRVGATAHFGGIYPHHESIRYVLDERISGTEISISTDSYGRNPWEGLYRFPRYGVGYLYTGLGNDRVYGKAHSAFLFMDIPFSKKQKQFGLSYQICMGLGYLTRRFDLNENPLNPAISTPMNVYLSFRLNARVRLKRRSELTAGLNLGHYSNGKTGTPNLGLNTVALQVGYRYNLLLPKYDRLPPPVMLASRKHQIELALSGGWKADDQLTANTYFAASFAGDYRYVFSKRYSAGAGIDLFYDGALGPNKEAHRKQNYNRADLYQAGLHGVFAVRVSKLQVFLNAGTYVYARYTKYSRVFGRLGVRYDLTPNVFLNLSIKSHYAIADFVEWGVGYRINFSGDEK